MKQCHECKRNLELINFNKNKNKKDKLQSQCKDCDKQYRDTPENKKRHAEWQTKPENKKRRAEWQAKPENKEKIAEQHKRYYEGNKDKIKLYYAENKEDVRQYKAQYQKNRLLTDIQFKLRTNLRIRLYDAIKGHFKSGSAVRDLGCTILELKIYLENQFEEGMSWENHGKWHIDHKLPLKSFNLSNRNQFLKAVHYTNLQPLWKYDNLSKGCRIII